MKETIRRAQSIPRFVGAMTSLPPDIALPLEKHQAIEESDLAQMAQATKNIIVGAYDGESYVIWQLPT